MSVGPELGVASVLIVPDLRGFEAQLVAQVSAAARAAGAAAGGAGAAGGAAAGAQTAAITKQTAALEARGAVLLGVTDAELALSAATGVETKAAAQNAAVNAEAGASAKAKAAADRVAAKAALEHAAAMEQLSRGAGAAILTTAGVRGATLAASAPFLIGTAAVVSFVEALKEASAEEEAAARVTKVLGVEGGKTAETWAHGLAQGFGLSATAALKFEGAIAEVFHNVGIVDERTQEFSQNLVKLSADVGAFNNADPTQVLRAFQLGLSGNLRGLRQFIPGVTAARVAFQAMADTGKQVKADLTDQELTIARYEVILQAASNQVGSFSERSGDLAAQGKILKSELANLAAGIGSILIPAFVDLARDAEQVLSPFEKLIDLARRYAPVSDKAADASDHHKNSLQKLQSFLGGSLLQQWDHFTHRLDLAGQQSRQLAADLGLVSPPARNAAQSVGVLGVVLSSLVGEAQTAGTGILHLAGSLEQAGLAFQNFFAIIRTFVAFTPLREATNQFESVSAASQRVRAEGGSLAAQAAAQAKVVAAAQKELAAADALTKERPRSKEAQNRQRQAISDLDAAQSQADALAAQAASAANKGVKAAAAVGKSAQQILDEEDQNLLTNQQIAVTTNDIARAKAGLTKSLVDDLAADEARLKIYIQQRKDAQKIHDEVLKKQTLQQLTLDIISTRGDIKTNQAQQAQNRRDRIVNAADAKVQSAQLDADLAETLGHKKDQISALERENRALDAEREHWKGNTLKLKEIRNQIATNNAKIKEIKGLTDDRNRLSSELAFSFLQAQQGFAATVMSNLLSAGAVAGSVGGATNAAISTRTPLGDSGILQRKGAGDFPGGPDAAVTTAAVTGAVRGATAGQMNRQISLTVEIRDLLKRLNGRATHPEANYQRAAQTTDMAHNV